MKHFTTRKAAELYVAQHPGQDLRIRRKRPGMPRRYSHPYLVGTWMELLNYNY